VQTLLINKVLHVFLVPEKIYFAFFKGGDELCIKDIIMA